MLRFALLALLTLVAATVPAHAWGPEGHRAIADAAERALSPEARRRLKPLMEGDSLADLSTRLDERRSDAEWEWASRLHYDNVPPTAEGYDAARDCPDGRCAASAIAHFAHVLADESRSVAERREAVEFLAHVVGDIHQPLHVGYAFDRGGNDHAIVHGEADNLHALWDGPLAVEAVATPFDAIPVSGGLGEPAQWADESLGLTRRVVYDLPAGQAVPDWYRERSVPIIRERMAASAGRLAALLESGLAGEAPAFADPVAAYDRSGGGGLRVDVGTVLAALLLGGGLLSGGILMLRSRRRGGLASLYLAEPAMLVLTVLAVLLTLCIDLALPVIYGEIFDQVLIPGELGALPGIILRGSPMLFATIAGQILMAWSVPRMAANRARAMRLKLAHGVHHAPPGSLREVSDAEVLSRFQSDLPQIENAMVNAVPRLVRGSVTLLGAVALMLWLDWRIALVALACLPLAGALPRLLGGRAHRADRKRQQAEEGAAGLVLDILHGVDLIRAYGLQRHFEARYAALAEGIRDRSMRAATLGMLGASAAGLGAILTTIVILTLGTTIAVQAGVSAGVMAGFGSLLALVGASVNRLGGAIPALSRASSGWRRVGELHAQIGEVALADPSTAPTAGIGDGVRLVDVRFSHDGERQHLDGVDLELPSGSRTALVGSSGCGKSTLLSILLGEVVPNSGGVVFGDAMLQPSNADAIRTRIAYVPQRSVLFDGTVSDNIRLGWLQATDAQIIQAAHRACIHDTIQRLPERYETPVGQGAVGLSGGQRQRIGLARALVRPADLLVLDEVTSALDPASARSVLDAILAGAEDKTLLAVTHRLDVARRLDRIAVMAEGRLVDVGSHQELLTRCGEYRRLYRAQDGMQVSMDGRSAVVLPERLARMPIFSEVPEDQLGALAEGMSVERHAQGELIVRAGEPGDTLMLIARGQCDVFEPDGRFVQTFDSGDVLGEIALLLSRPRTANIVAKGAVTLFVLSRAMLDEVVPDGDPLRVRMLELAQQRLARSLS